MLALLHIFFNQFIMGTTPRWLSVEYLVYYVFITYCYVTGGAIVVDLSERMCFLLLVWIVSYLVSLVDMNSVLGSKCSSVARNARWMDWRPQNCASMALVNDGLVDSESCLFTQMHIGSARFAIFF